MSTSLSQRRNKDVMGIIFYEDTIIIRAYNVVEVSTTS
jgi:hypothetical protein